MSASLYEELGVAREATAKQIKSAHRNGVRKHHPDKGGCREKFQRVQHAYDILSDPEKRRRYDETGDDGSKSDGITVESIIAQAWNEVIEQLSPEDHLVESLHATILQAAQAAQKGADGASRKLAKFEAILKRLKHGSVTTLRDVLEHRCKEQKARRYNCQQSAAKLLEAIDALKSADYLAEAMPRRHREPGFSQMRWNMRAGDAFQ